MIYTLPLIILSPSFSGFQEAGIQVQRLLTVRVTANSTNGAMLFLILKCFLWSSNSIVKPLGYLKVLET